MRYHRQMITTLAMISFLSMAVGHVMAADRVTISRGDSDESIRKQLLTHTPIGSTPQSVLSFIYDSLRTQRDVAGDGYYIDEYEKATGKKVKAAKWTRKRFISVVVSEGFLSLFVSEQISARWHFNHGDKLTDITIDRHGVGP